TSLRLGLVPFTHHVGGLYSAQKALVSPDRGGAAEGQDAAENTERSGNVDLSLLDLMQQKSKNDPNASAFLAGGRQGEGRTKGRNRTKGQNRTEELGPWPPWIPEPPHWEVWKALGGDYLSPTYVANEWRVDIVTARDIATAQNAWSSRLDAEQREAAEQYRQCARGKSDICYATKRIFPKGQPIDEEMRRQFDEAAAHCNTLATRYGAAADYVEAHLNYLNGAEKAKAGNAVSALRAFGTWAAKAAKFLGTGAAIAGLTTDLTALFSAAHKLAVAKPGEVDKAAAELFTAFVTFCKDVVIVGTPPLVSVTLSVANAALCEINPNWVSDMTEGVLKLAQGSKSNRSDRHSAPQNRRGGMVDQINYNRLGGR
ncbi:MAG: hypothetical protein RIT45_2078, partial [Pseudomonadota bacterium]